MPPRWRREGVSYRDLPETHPYKVQSRKRGRSYMQRLKAVGDPRYQGNSPPAARHIIAVRTRLKRFGLTIETFEQLRVAQHDVCAICGEPETARASKAGIPKLLSVDHSHSTGHVRGLLCQSCNIGIGCFKDDILRLQSAISYLQKHLRA